MTVEEWRRRRGLGSSRGRVDAGVSSTVHDSRVCVARMGKQCAYQHTAARPRRTARRAPQHGARARRRARRARERLARVRRRRRGRRVEHARAAPARRREDAAAGAGRPGRATRAVRGRVARRATDRRRGRRARDLRGRHAGDRRERGELGGVFRVVRRRAGRGTRTRSDESETGRCRRART